jgi:hypothetical protein
MLDLLKLSRGPMQILQTVWRVEVVDRAQGGGPPSRLRRSGAASFAWLAEPKLTLRR